MELMGTMAGDAELYVASTISMPLGEAHVELRDDTVKLMHMT